MPKALPIKLGKEPLLEAVCELRVSPAGALHTVLPGYLYAMFPGEITSLEQLPAGAIPEAMRAQEPALAHAPAIRVEWRGYSILVGPRNVALACRMPYPGWLGFKKDILELFTKVLASNLVRGIDRYSLKYVNFFPSADGNTGVTSMMDWTMRIGEIEIDADKVQVRVEIPDGDLITVLTVASPVAVKRADNLPATGGVVDADTICAYVTNDIDAFGAELDSRLEAMRHVNKQAFFDSLTNDAITRMEPDYGGHEKLSGSLH